MKPFDLEAIDRYLSKHSGDEDCKPVIEAFESLRKHGSELEFEQRKQALSDLESLLNFISEQYNLFADNCANPERFKEIYESAWTLIKPEGG